MNLLLSSGTSPQYQNGHGFIGPARDEQTEPVDFSTANEPVTFGSIRPVATFAGPVLTAAGTGYSRESTPDSGGSHYMEAAYRDAATGGQIGAAGARFRLSGFVGYLARDHTEQSDCFARDLMR